MSIKTNFLLLFTDLQARARNCFLSNINISLHKPRKAVVVSFSRLRLRWHSLLSALQRMQTVTLSFHDSVLTWWNEPHQRRKYSAVVSHLCHICINSPHMLRLVNQDHESTAVCAFGIKLSRSKQRPANQRQVKPPLNDQ